MLYLQYIICVIYAVKSVKICMQKDLRLSKDDNKSLKNSF